MKIPLKVRAAIVDRSLAGESIEETADDFGLSVAEVQSIVDAVPIDLREMFAAN
jgi:DNA-directed RNA polymerase specialized sigma24 family protein